MALKKLKELAVWMNGELTGYWNIDRHIQQFTYTDSWYEFVGKRPLSLSLPLQYPGYRFTGKVVENYFDNLLPDTLEIRRRYQIKYGISSTKTFDLLTEIGRDCIGAIQLLPRDSDGSDVKKISGKEVTDDEIEQILKHVPANNFFSRSSVNDFRISLAGAQEKTAFTKYKEKWLIPQGSTPSTHIFKLPLGVVGHGQIDLSSSIENEWLCSKIIGLYKLPVAKSEIAHFGTEKALIVERFDRRLSPDNWFIRIPQEDMCQVMGLPSALKYENEGGIGIKKIMDILRGSESSMEDRLNFMKAQIIYWLMAAPDGHAKNFSIFINARESFRLTPFYDIISAYPVLGHSAGKLQPQKLKMAMAIQGKNRHYKWDSITCNHWKNTCKICGISQQKTNNLLESIILSTPDVMAEISSVIPKGFPQIIADTILEGMHSAVKIMKQ